MKRYLLVMSVSLLLAACTKEGLPGPQGPDGQEGDAGAPGTGGGGTGGITPIWSTITQSDATYTWVQESTNPTSVTYRLKWKVPTGPYVADNFVLGDEVSGATTRGGLIVYVSEGEDAGAHHWHKLPFTSADFNDLFTYRYEYEMQGETVIIKIYGDRLTAFGAGALPPSIHVNVVKVVALPETVSVNDPFIF